MTPWRRRQLRNGARALVWIRTPLGSVIVEGTVVVEPVGGVVVLGAGVEVAGTVIVCPATVRVVGLSPPPPQPEASPTRAATTSARNAVNPRRIASNTKALAFSAGATR